MEKKILVETKRVWGNILNYPRCELSEILCKILEVKSLSADKLKLLKEIGIEVNFLRK